MKKSVFLKYIYFSLILILDSNSVLSIAQLNKIPSNQNIYVKATVKRISDIRKLHLDGEVVDKRELTVADPTGGIKVLL